MIAYCSKTHLQWWDFRPQHLHQYQENEIFYIWKEFIKKNFFVESYYSYLIHTESR